MMQNFGGRKFSETVHTKNWWIILWRMPKIARAPKVIIMHQILPVKWNHKVSRGEWLK